MLDHCRKSKRGLLGYSYRPQVISNPTIAQTTNRSLYQCYDFAAIDELYEKKKHDPQQDIETPIPPNMNGEGIFSDAFDGVYRKAATGIDNVIDEAHKMAKHARRTTAEGVRKAASIIEGSGLGVAGSVPMYDVSGGACCEDMLPGDELKLKLLKKMAKSKPKPNRKMVSGKGLPELSTPELTRFLVKVAIPTLFKKSVHLPKPAELLQMVQPLVKSFKGDTLNLVKHIAAKIIPPVAKSMMKVKDALGMSGNGNISKVDRVILKHAGFSGKGLTTSGGALKLAGQRGRRGQYGRGIAGDISGMMVKGLFNMVRAFWKSKHSNVGGILGSGMGQSGGRFTQWFKKTTGQTPSEFGSDFVKGFSFVFKPGAKILSPIAKAAGIAPLGMVLDTAGKVLPDVSLKDITR